MAQKFPNDIFTPTSSLFVIENMFLLLEMLSDDSSSDDDEEIEAIVKGAITMSHNFCNSDSDSSESTPKWGGSRPGRSPNTKGTLLVRMIW